VSCPHNNAAHCPLYRAAHVPGAGGCDDGRLAEGGCAADRGLDYAGAVESLRISHPRIVAEAEWAADAARITDQQRRNMRAAGIQ
jgi:hypothetical protein